MSISIEHSMPVDLVLEDASQFGVFRPGNIVTETETGLRRSRSYSDHNLAIYNLRFVSGTYTEETYQAQLALLHSTALNALPFWVKEPISKPRIAVPGELTDGVQKTFINPLDISSPVVTIGLAVDQTSPTQHAVANLMSATQANAVGGATTGCSAWGTCVIAATRYPVLDGQYAFLIDPTGTVGNVGLQMTGANKIVIPEAVQKYTVGASFLSTNASHVYKVQGQFYDGATPGAIFSDTDSAPVGEWLHLRASADSTANDDAIIFTAGRTTSSADSFIVACNMISPGDFQRWFLPSLAPRLTEWASAPAANNRLRFSSASCQRWARVALNRDVQMATMELLGDTTPQQMPLREAVFTS